MEGEIDYRKIRKVIPEDVEDQEMQTYIINAIEFYKNNYIKS